MNKLKIGNIVKWRCSPFGRESFIAEGVIRKFTRSSFGGLRIPMKAVKVEVLGRYKEIFPKRKTTTIAVHNLLTPKKGEVE